MLSGHSEHVQLLKSNKLQRSVIRTPEDKLSADMFS